MDEASSATSPARIVPRSRPYLRLLWIIPALAILGVGSYFQYNVAQGGQVNAVKLTTKPGMVGQAAEAVANIKLGTPDLYLKITTTSGEVSLPVMKNTPVGNGLTWNLPKPYSLEQIQRVDVWNHNTILSDDPLDRITMAGWGTDGQMFHIDLLGQRIEAPTWALPTAVVGGVLTLLVVLRFVWDQVI